MRYSSCRNETGTGWRGVVAALVALLAGCGMNEEPPPSNPPSFEGANVTCKDLQEDDLDRPVLRKITISVTDPERDLVTEGGQLCGTVNGLPIALGDPDADGQFTWRPDKELDENPCDGEIPLDQNRMVCDGPFELYVTARDADGNTAEFDDEIEAGGSQ